LVNNIIPKHQLGILVVLVQHPKFPVVLCSRFKS
jgi:hypothetical protein